MESNPSVPPGDGEQIHEQALDNSQQQPSPARPTLTVVRADGLPHLRTLFRKKERKYYITATDGLRIKKTSAIRSIDYSVQWNEILSGLTVGSSSRLVFHIFARRTWLRDVRLGLLSIPFESIRSSPLQEFDISFDPIRKTTLVLSITLPEVSRATFGAVSSPETLPAPSALEGAQPGSSPEPNTSSDDPNSADPVQVAETSLARAGEAIAGLGSVPSVQLELAKAADGAPDQLGKVADLYDTWKVALANVKFVVDVVDKISVIHPWAKMAWSILSCIPKTLIAQIERDENFRTLLVAIRDAFDLAKEAKDLMNLLPGSTQVRILKEMLRHVGACGDLIQAYAKDTSFWQRLVKNMGDNASGQVKRYSETLVELRRGFLDHAAINTQTAVAELSRELEELAGSVAGIDLAVTMANIPYPKGARHNKDRVKRCIPETRVAFLDHITHWVNDPESPRALVLFGQAGTGKSSIANEVACRFEETHRLASSFVFLRLTAKTEQSDSPAQRLFSGIARNLADRYPTFKASLAKIINEDTSVLSARDYTTPFESMLLRPLQESPLIGPIFIVIDALDESGDASGGDGLHSFLASHISELPDTFRILITSRPEKDIVDAFNHPDSLTITEIRHMDDPVLSRQTGDDIYAFIRHQFRTSPGLLEQYGAGLAKKAENSFQWAAVACKHVQFGPAGLTPSERADQLLKLPSESPESVNFLDSLYKEILSAYFGSGKAPPSKFTSIMGQIIAAFEPLSTSSLATLRSYNDPPDLTGEDSVRSIVGYLGSLLSNVTPPDSSLPIVPLHASFRDFLIDQKRAERFWIDISDAHYQLTRCSFGLMHDKLRLNICKLLSSYDHNPDIQDPSSRIAEYISDALSYACRSWDDHLEHVSPDKIVDVVQSFFENDFLHWLEAMSLLGAINLVPPAMSILGSWVAKNRNNHHLPELAALTPWVRDVLRFMRYFGRPIGQSAPHIYLSALPFCPEASIIFDCYAKYFPNTSSLQRGRMSSWPAQEMTIPVDSMCFAIAFSPDGRRIAGSHDHTIRVWDAETGHAVAGSFTGHTESVNSVAFSPDGRRVTSGSSDNTIRVWDAETGHTAAGPFTGHTGPVASVVFSPDGRRIASCSVDSTIRVWDAETGHVATGPFTGHASSVYSIAFSPDGRRIASGSDDHTIRVWDAEKGHTVAGPFTGHTSLVYSVTFSPDGRRIVSGSDDNAIRVWDAEKGHTVAGPFTGHTRSVHSVAFSPDGHWIASGSSDCTIRVWDAETGHSVAAPFTGHTSSVNSVAFSPDGRHISSGSDDNTIRIWDAEKGYSVAAPFTGHTESVNSVTFSPDGRLIASGSDDCTIRVYDAETGHAAAGPFMGHTNSVWPTVFSPDSRRIASGSHDLTIRVWDTETGRAVAEPFTGHTDPIWSVAFSPDSRRIVSGSGDNTIRVWDAEKGHAVAGPFTEHTGMVLSVTFSPDGRRIASGSSDYTIRVWDAETGHSVAGPFTGHTSWAMSVVYSPDGRRIASGSDDKTIRVWDAEKGHSLVKPFTGHEDSVNSVVFSPDGRRIASGSSDCTIRVWDAETGHSVAGPFAGHTSMVRSVAFSPDGRHLASGSHDKSIRLWEVIICGVAEHSGSTLQDVPQPSIAVQAPPGFTDQSVIDDEGWICGQSGELLMWIPEPHRLGLHRPSNVWIAAENETRLDLSRFVHGRDWVQCGGQMSGTTQ